MALEDGDLVLFHQKFDAPRQFRYDLVLALHDLVEMEFETFDTDAEFLWIGNQIINVGGMKKLFGGYATSQKTGAAEIFILFDDRCFQTNLCGADGSDITSG